MDIVQSDLTTFIALLAGLSAAAVLVFGLLYKKEEIRDEFRGRIRKIKDEVDQTNLKPSQTSTEPRGELAVMLDKLMEDATVYVEKSEKAAKVNNTALNMKATIYKSVLKTVKNPYNGTSPMKMFIMISVTTGLGLLFSAILQNTILSFVAVVLGIAIPFTLANLTGNRNLMKNKNDNLHLMSIFLLNYKDAEGFESALRKCLKSFDQRSLEYQAVDKTLDALMHLNMPLHDALNLLLKEINAGLDEVDFFATVEQAETVDNKYKNILSTILKNFDSITTENYRHTQFAYILYFIYIVAIVLSVCVLFFMKNVEPESYETLRGTIKGQSSVLFVFITECILGIVIAIKARPIDLTGVMAKSNSDEEDDIYV